MVCITGASSHHLNDGLTVDHAFGESGGVELLSDGRVEIDSDAGVARDALQRLRQLIGVTVEDGFADTLRRFIFYFFNLHSGQIPAALPRSYLAIPDPHFRKDQV